MLMVWSEYNDVKFDSGRGFAVWSRPKSILNNATLQVAGFGH